MRNLQSLGRRPLLRARVPERVLALCVCTVNRMRHTPQLLGSATQTPTDPTQTLAYPPRALDSHPNVDPE